MEKVGEKREKVGSKQDDGKLWRVGKKGKEGKWERREKGRKEKGGKGGMRKSL